MNTLVQITVDDDGHETKNADWHLVDPCNEGGPAALCTQEYFGEGESSCQYQTKTVARGGVTCANCLRKLRAYKAVRL